MRGPQCKAHTTSGRPCRNTAIHGGVVCVVHGGRAPQVMRKAAERLKEARDVALAKFLQYLGLDLVDPKTALDASVKLTELTETLEGRVARREEQVTTTQYDDLSDEELKRAVIAEAEAVVRHAATDDLPAALPVEPPQPRTSSRRKPSSRE